MRDIGADTTAVRGWFGEVRHATYTSVTFNVLNADAWTAAVKNSFRKCYVTDRSLHERATATGLSNALVIQAHLPDPGSVMAGDFGEILTYFYQAQTKPAALIIGPKKWRLKETRTKAAPYSDVVQLVVPKWPSSSADDELLCAEVKTKSTSSAFAPVTKAIEGCDDDRTSRLAKTLVWLKDRAITTDLESVEVAHLNRFIQADAHPPASKKFRAVAVVCSSLINGELLTLPSAASSEYELVLISVPDLYNLYMNTFKAVLTSAD